VAKTSLILLHAPSVYDFRTRPILHGPVSDVVPSTQVFEMYPIGFMTILEYLQRHGHSVRIINVALKMLRARRFDAEKLIRSLSPAAFGIDLHWLVHVQGSLELAALVKKLHPDIPVIFGGLSASYYHEELIRYPQVDYVVRGDSAEEPLRRLVAAIEGGDGVEAVPNLTWKHDGEVRVNEFSHRQEDIDDVSFDYGNVIRSCVKHLDFTGPVPFSAWFRYPIVAALTCRGCVHDCAICGGSASAYERICKRARPAHRSPDHIARDIGQAARYMRAPVMILGDILQGGAAYGRELLAALKKEGVRNHLAFEFFAPPPTEFVEMIADAAPNFNIQISPESHDENTRRLFGRPYGNDEFETFITDALGLGCSRIDTFFMIGIPGQTPQSVRDTVSYCRKLLAMCREAGHDGKLRPFISPLAPFLDPGSRAFEEPEKHGYRLFCRTLEEHRKALEAPSWKRTLNYETKWMSRDEIVDVTYEAALGLNRLKMEFGLTERAQGQRLEQRIERERALVGEIDLACESADEAALSEKLAELLGGFDRVGPATICEKEEMNWPVGLLRFNPLGILKAVFSRD